MGAFADNYSAVPGVVIRGGRSAAGRPAWRTAMAANTWREIPTSNTMADLNPKFNPALNPNYPNNPEWSGTGDGHPQIVLSWNGQSYDEATDTAHNGPDGGHADYAGNEHYKVNYRAESPAYVMTLKPSGAIGDLLITNDGQEATGLYANGKPRPIHSYNKHVFIPGIGPAIAVQAGTAWSGQGGQARPMFFDEASGEMTRFGAVNANMYASKGGTCYDPTRHALWFRHSGSGKMALYDIAGDSWTFPGASIAFDGDSGLCYLPGDDCVLWVGGFFANGFAVYDCATGTLHQPPVEGAFVGMLVNNRSQPRWVPSLNAAAMWDNPSATTSINTLVKPFDPRTGTWQRAQLPVAAGNSVTPTVKTTNGTFGRFAYSPFLGGFIVWNATNQRPFFYALD